MVWRPTLSTVSVVYHRLKYRLSAISELCAYDDRSNNKSAKVTNYCRQTRNGSVNYPKLCCHVYVRTAILCARTYAAHTTVFFKPTINNKLVEPEQGASRHLYFQVSSDTHDTAARTTVTNMTAEKTMMMTTTGSRPISYLLNLRSVPNVKL